MKTRVLLALTLSLALGACSLGPTAATITKVQETGPCVMSFCTQYYLAGEAGEVWYTGSPGAPGLDLQPGTTIYLEGGRITDWENPS